MAKDKMSPKDINERIAELKKEILKQTQKRKSIKREIARLLTMKSLTKLGEKK